MAGHQRISTANDQRENGRQQVFEAIRQAGRIARIDIARETQVSPATVTAITSELLSAGLIEEITPEGDRTGAKRGRPRVALKVRGAAHLIAGIKISDRSATVILVDFEGQTVGEYDHELPGPVMSPEEMVSLVMRALGGACNAAGRDISEVSGVGLGIAGLIDATRNFVHWSPSLDQRNVELGRMLSDAMPVPFYMDNDANLVAKAEQLFGEARNVSDFIVITIEQGVGMGIVIDGRIYRGERGCGAEFGHTKVQLDGALCRCGQRGCLEAYVGDYALLREANIRGSAQPEDDLSALYARAKAGDAMARSIFDRAGRMFAMGLANVINIFDPSLVILSGEQMTFDFLYGSDVLERVKSSVVQVDAPLPEIRVHKWGDLMWAKGAAACAMEGVSELTIRNLGADAA
ncbi:ROK family transcriptional regulator [Nioella sediminis]|uniref:ROK family transcriptional regulator n=1 Tax=Nioella sediminis TaxID=1912092 RepID=UPI0008FCFD42|nr:ROK family transcriptional regulator [Nioella sediminis]TBX28639.1 ROK family transcriptional regulator [Roseovarius sp. JS7-11]